MTSGWSKTPGLGTAPEGDYQGVIRRLLMGYMTHLDSSERFLDSAGETLVRSVDPGLLVGGRADLGKENFQLESSSFNLNAWINLAAETHFHLCTNK